MAAETLDSIITPDFHAQLVTALREQAESYVWAEVTELHVDAQKGQYWGRASVVRGPRAQRCKLLKFTRWSRASTVGQAPTVASIQILDAALESSARDVPPLAFAPAQGTLLLGKAVQPATAGSRGRRPLPRLQSWVVLPRAFKVLLTALQSRTEDITQAALSAWYSSLEPTTTGLGIGLLLRLIFEDEVSIFAWASVLEQRPDLKACALEATLFVHDTLQALGTSADLFVHTIAVRTQCDGLAQAYRAAREHMATLAAPPAPQVAPAVVEAAAAQWQWQQQQSNTPQYPPELALAGWAADAPVNLASPASPAYAPITLTSPASPAYAPGHDEQSR